MLFRFCLFFQDWAKGKKFFFGFLTLISLVELRCSQSLYDSSFFFSIQDSGILISLPSSLPFLKGTDLVNGVACPLDFKKEHSVGTPTISDEELQDFLSSFTSVVQNCTSLLKSSFLTLPKNAPSEVSERCDLFFSPKPPLYFGNLSYYALLETFAHVLFTHFSYLLYYAISSLTSGLIIIFTNLYILCTEPMFN